MITKKGLLPFELFFLIDPLLSLINLNLKRLLPVLREGLQSF